MDDCLRIGNREAINEAIKDLKKHHLTLTKTTGLNDYLSCEVVLSKDKKKAWLGQPYLVKKLRDRFGNKVKELQRYRTPGTPGVNVKRPKDDSEKSQMRNNVYIEQVWECFFISLNILDQTWQTQLGNCQNLWMELRVLRIKNFFE